MFQSIFLEQSIWLNSIFFMLAASVIWISGIRLSQYADAISDRLRIGKAFMGLVFLAGATELPELVTTITASIEGNARLVLNNMFGGITMQTAILAIADAVLIHATLTFYPRKPTPALEGTLLCLLLSILLAVTFLGDIALFWNIGLGAIFFSVAYWMAITLLRNYDRKTGWHPVEIIEDDDKSIMLASGKVLDKTELKRLYWLSALATTAILIAGILLVSIAEALAKQSGLGSSFIGVTLLAASTSLPELSTTISAIRLGAYTMAISNIFGSNLIMLALLLPADIFYREGVLLKHADRSAQFAIITGIIVSAVYVIGLLVRHKKRYFNIGIDSLCVLAIYMISLIVFYNLR